MIIDQGEIDALLAQAGAAAEPTRPAPPVRTPPPPPPIRSTPETRRILRIAAPVIVQLAARKMSLSEVRRLSAGVILEFEKPVDSPLDLMVNNRIIGHGQTVKVGEKFGLRIEEIHSPVQRVRSLGA
jgi:flagellar motor switch protein FliN/FliY